MKKFYIYRPHDNFFDAICINLTEITKIWLMPERPKTIQYSFKDSGTHYLCYDTIEERNTEFDKILSMLEKL